MRFTMKSDSGENKLALIQNPNPFEPNQGEWMCDTDHTGKYHTLYGEFVDKLAEYEDAEEQGLLLRLPCKVKDRVYVILPGDSYIRISEVCEIKVKPAVFGSLCFITEPIAYRGVHYKCYESDFGKTVFLTKSEAEQALKRMEYETNEIG